MALLVEPACAKVNLTLEILGRRPDGYHALASLVVFAADAADTLTLAPDAETRVVTRGPFAPTIAGENLVAVALAKATTLEPRLAAGRITLDKHLPVAAGIGGGSADAAAVLRLLRRNNPAVAAAIDWHALAVSLGADVPVCLASRATFMTGIGDVLTLLNDLPPLDAVLVNPRVAVPADKTAQVFRRLGAPPLDEAAAAPSPPHFTATDDLMTYLTRRRNSLEDAARGVVPAIDGVLAALSATAGCRLARLSGGGPTCFGLYDDAGVAKEAAVALAAAHPRWWVTATALR